MANTKRYKKQKITETLANGYSSESTRRELSNEYQDDRVSMVFQESCIWTKVVSVLEGLRNLPGSPWYATGHHFMKYELHFISV